MLGFLQTFMPICIYINILYIECHKCSNIKQLIDFFNIGTRPQISKETYCEFNKVFDQNIDTGRKKSKIKPDRTDF